LPTACSASKLPRCAPSSKPPRRAAISLVAAGIAAAIVQVEGLHLAAHEVHTVQHHRGKGVDVAVQVAPGRLGRPSARPR
jgi:hypothetical protein